MLRAWRVRVCCQRISSRNAGAALGTIADRGARIVAWARGRIGILPGFTLIARARRRRAAYILNIGANVFVNKCVLSRVELAVSVSDSVANPDSSSSIFVRPTSFAGHHSKRPL